MAAHARLRNEFMEDEKYHNLMAWLICYYGELTKLILQYIIKYPPYLFFLFVKTCLSKYRNFPKFRANSADPDQTAPDQGLHCLQFPLYLLDALL